MMLLGSALQWGAGLLVLAGASGPLTVCTVPDAPAVRVSPQTAPIQYDYSQSSAALDRMAGRHHSGGRDSSTGGLRLDRPEVHTRVRWGYNQESINGKPTRVCLWYTDVEVTIKLQPVIYVASEHAPGRCRDAILGHERRHVEVDRVVMNRFAADVGGALKNLVDRTGAWGPYPASRKEDLGKKLMQQVQDTVAQYERQMQTTMNTQQAAVDSREEYARISAICNEERNQTRRQRR